MSEKAEIIKRIIEQDMQVLALGNFGKVPNDEHNREAAVQQITRYLTDISPGADFEVEAGPAVGGVIDVSIASSDPIIANLLRRIKEENE